MMIYKHALAAFPRAPPPFCLFLFSFQLLSQLLSRSILVCTGDQKTSSSHQRISCSEAEGSAHTTCSLVLPSMDVDVFQFHFFTWMPDYLKLKVIHSVADSTFFPFSLGP